MKNIVLSIGLLAGLSCAAQTYVINDDFDNNDNGWGEWRSRDSYAKVDDGHYLIENRHADNNAYFYKSFALDPNVDFVIETKMKVTEGPDDMGFGLIMFDDRVSDKRRWHYFRLSGNQYFSALTWEEETDESVYHQEWEQDTKLINGYGEYNTLKIVKEGTKFYFYINEKEVLKKNKIDFWGREIGFLLHDRNTVYIDYITIEQEGYEMTMITEVVEGAVKENLGEKINSEFDELGPLISHDGGTLYFFRKEHPDNMSDDDDVWYSKRMPNGDWSRAKNIGEPINNDSPNFLFSISADNNTMLIANQYDEYGNADGPGISIAYRTRNGWTVPEDVEVKDYYNNNKYTMNCLSPDQNVLIMALEREDSDAEGECDLYVSFRDDKGDFSKPLHTGSVLNSFGDDSTPFLAADGVTIYFSSNGHPGFGSSDIFMSRRLDDTWTNWSTPVNLGPQINTPDWDAYYSVPASGEFAYLVSSYDSYGEGDIFRIVLHEEAAPDPVALIYGTVLDSKTGDPIEAEITYYDMATREEIGSARSNPTDGSYSIILPYGKTYSFRAKEEGYIAISQNLDLTEVSEYQEIERDLLLTPIEVGQTIRLNNIFFEYDKATLLSESFEELDRLVKILKDNPKMEIEIGGHTDDQGSEDYNLNLSQERVNSVVAYLIENGIKESRLTGKGYGESNPIADNSTEQGQELNRRVEFSIIKN